MEPPRTHQATMLSAPTTFKWKTVIALTLLLIAIMLNWSWVYGILFIAWAIADIATKRVYFVEEVTRAKNPILLWIIVILWLLLGIYSLLESFFPYLSS